MAFICFFPLSLFSQNCLTNGISFGSQTDIDNFTTNFPGCSIIDGDVEIMDDGSGISNLLGLSAVSEIGGSLVIDINSHLSSLCGLENLESIGGDLQISFNVSLTNLDGLSELNSIDGFVDIVNNASLISLSGLSALTSINGFLQVSNNISLPSLSGLENIDPSGISDLLLLSGDELQFCHLVNLCSYLDEGGTASIADNGKGCATAEVVEVACSLVSVADIQKDELIVFPMPTFGTIWIEGVVAGGEDYIIIDQSGEVEIVGRLSRNKSIDVSGLSAGSYFLVLAERRKVSRLVVAW
ncbi:MAG: hypothetical protein AAF502_16830 [Bacteroidota bacterium]